MGNGKKKAQTNLIFNEDKLISLRDRVALTNSNDNHFLLEYINQLVSDKLDTFNFKADKILLIGAISKDLVQILENKFQTEIIITDLSNQLLKQFENHQTYNLKNLINTVKPKSFDLVFSYLDLHHINDVRGYLLNCYKLLKDDGLFLASFFGGTSLNELRKTVITAESKLGGATARIFPFIDIKTAGMLLQNTNFKSVISDSDYLKVEYRDINKLFHDLKNIAESNILLKTNKSLLSRKKLDFITETYLNLYRNNQDKACASFEIINLSAFK